MIEEFFFRGLRYTRNQSSKRQFRRTYFMRKTTVFGKKKEILLHRKVWESENGKIPNRFAVHHMDGDPGNNLPENLVAVHPKDHAKLHKEDIKITCQSPKQKAQFAEWYEKKYGKKVPEKKPKLDHPIKTCVYCKTEYKPKRIHKINVCGSATCYYVYYKYINPKQKTMHKPTEARKPYVNHRAKFND